MKCIIAIFPIAVWWSCLGQAEAQQFSLEWSSIDAGGSAAAGSLFSLSGAIGQSDVGVIDGSAYTMQGGFWSVVSIQTTAPLLRIGRTATGGVIISWQAPATNFVLQESSTLGQSANWTDVDASVIPNGTENTVVQPVAPGGRFYRLHQP